VSGVSYIRPLVAFAAAMLVVADGARRLSADLLFPCASSRQSLPSGRRGGVHTSQRLVLDHLAGGMLHRASHNRVMFMVPPVGDR
jgi:hypothetical protein